MRARGLAWFAAGALLLASVDACELARETVATGTAQIVVHAVLNPGATEQQILVEQTLVGVARTRTDLRFDPRDPVNSGGGVPVRAADVRITGPDGTFRALEVAGGGTYGAGFYLLQTGINGRPPIRPGARYTLTVTTTTGIVVTGTTLVPNASPVTSATGTTILDRNRDTLHINVSPVSNARTFGLRIDSPFGPFLLFSDSTSLNLPGTLRNVFSENLQRAFIPGFRQAITIYASDTNFFDYYRSRNDPFTGSGLINHLQGGIGLFGSTVNVAQRIAEVTQAVREPAFEGTYVLAAQSTAKTVIDSLQLYVETAGNPAALSGRHWANRGIRDGVVGTRTNGSIVLYFLRNQDASDTTAAFIGQQIADSLVGSYVSVPGRVVFRRRP